mmetsp:Transcript_8725/g.11019  ORF Transcript_8725/g.11019 Transcript_8725/m.11019 type:complete len:195 (-) Transcript_8725:112-696(-)
MGVDTKKDRGSRGSFSFEEHSERTPSVKLPTDIKFVLHNREMRDAFEEYLVDRIAVESLKFIDSVKLYEHVEKPEWRTRAGRSILTKFISSSAQFQINISDEERQRLMNTKVFEKETFDSAKAAVISLLQENFFSSFIKYLLDPNSSTMEHRSQEDVQISYPKERYFGSASGIKKVRSNVYRLNNDESANEVEI